MNISNLERFVSPSLFSPISLLGQEQQQQQQQVEVEDEDPIEEDDNLDGNNNLLDVHDSIESSCSPCSFPPGQKKSSSSSSMEDDLFIPGDDDKTNNRDFIDLTGSVNDVSKTTYYHTPSQQSQQSQFPSQFQSQVFMSQPNPPSQLQTPSPNFLVSDHLFDHPSISNAVFLLNHCPQDHFPDFPITMFPPPFSINNDGNPFYCNPLGWYKTSRRHEKASDWIHEFIRNNQ